MSESASPSVLVVHDDPAGPDCPVDLLRERYRVEVTTDQDDAIQSLRDGADVTILDRTNADEVDGTDLVERIRRARVDCQILLQGNVRDGTGVESEADVLVPDSADPSTVYDLIEQLCALAAHEETKRTLSSLQVRRNVRRIELSAEERQTDPDYRDLCDRIDALETELAALRGRIDDPRLLERIDD